MPAFRKLQPRKRLSRKWIQNPRYVLTVLINKQHYSINLMEFAERLCKRDWSRAVNAAAKQTQASPTRYRSDSPASVWKRTMRAEGRRNSRGIRISRSTDQQRLAHGGPTYGVSMSVYKASVLTPRILSDALVTLLHELTHVAHLASMNASRSKSGNRRRPHDLAFNVIQYRMARGLWGYATEPWEAGWSEGRGYAPTRHLMAWLYSAMKAEDPKIMRYLSRCEAPLKPRSTTKARKPRPPVWEIEADGDDHVMLRWSRRTRDALWHYVIEMVSEPGDRAELADLIEVAPRKSAGYICRIPTRLLPYLKGECEWMLDLLDFSESPSQVKGVLRMLRALEEWEKGNIWSARGAECHRNWGWRGGIVQPINNKGE